MKKASSPSLAAFSLVEVAMALAISAFCLFALLGLLAVGLNLSHISTEQTVVTNVLSAIAADVRSAPNTSPKGGATQTLIFGINLPKTGDTNPATPQTIYLGEDGQIAPAATARYRLNIWTTAATTTQQETVARVLITWPAAASYTNAQGSVEGIIAYDRN